MASADDPGSTTSDPCGPVTGEATPAEDPATAAGGKHRVGAVGTAGAGELVSEELRTGVAGGDVAGESATAAA